MAGADIRTPVTAAAGCAGATRSTSSDELPALFARLTVSLTGELTLTTGGVAVDSTAVPAGPV